VENVIGTGTQGGTLGKPVRHVTTAAGRRARAVSTTAAIVALACTGVLCAGAGASAPSEPPTQCSWGLQSNPNVVNVEYPDLNAHYWGRELLPQLGGRLVIRGEYPAARYFSFHVYDEKLVPLDSIYDSQVVPNPGSSNPFVHKPKRGAGVHYTLYVEFKPKPSNPAPNTLYVGDTPQGTPTPEGTLMYRVYVPNNPSDPAGGAPLPQITWETEEGAPIQEYGACASNSIEIGGQLNEEIADSNWPEGVPAPPSPEATNRPTWARAFGSELVGVWANQQVAYLKTTISRQYGDVVVIRGKAPTFPDTRAGQPPYRKRQVRYWSFCENSETTRVIACQADYRAATNGGYYTYVVSDPDKRPANATAANGVTWLLWGGTMASGQVIYRNMLPAPSFAQAVQHVPEGASPQGVMGPYFPHAVYCTKAIFEAGGWSACTGQRQRR
jgi:hypothetical protein